MTTNFSRVYLEKNKLKRHPSPTIHHKLLRRQRVDFHDTNITQHRSQMKLVANQVFKKLLFKRFVNADKSNQVPRIMQERT
jgi:hypothetical protein